MALAGCSASRSERFASLQQAGAFRMTMPREWGGPEADPLTQIRVVEALSYTDGSVGWCSMIGSGGGSHRYRGPVRSQ